MYRKPPKKTEMEISIIIPVYNAGQYLEECLNSVASQHFQDWECLLIDDGSTDRSGHICDLYAKSDTRFRVFHTPNRGVSAARNLGIGHAAGNFLTFIDGDDTVEKEYLSELYRTAAPGVELTVCGMKHVFAERIETAYSRGGVFSLCAEEADRLVDLTRKYLLCGPTIKLYRSRIVKGKNIRFPEGVHYGEDLIFNLRYMEHVDRIAVSETTPYNYRRFAQGTLSTSRHSADFHANYRQWEMIRSFFGRRGIATPDAGLFLSDRLWGLAYDTAMSRRLTMKEIKTIFTVRLSGDLRASGGCSIAVPAWLRAAVLNRLHIMIWLLQRRAV